MEANQFRLNAGKTHLLTLGTAERLRILEDNLAVVMDGVRLEETVEKSEFLLGVTIQSDLKWFKQISELTLKLKNLRFLVDFPTRKKIVQGFFNSVLCYCLHCSTACLMMTFFFLPEVSPPSYIPRGFQLRTIQ